VLREFLGLASIAELCLLKDRRSCALVGRKAEAGAKPCAPEKPSAELPGKTGHLSAKGPQVSEV